MADVAAAPVEEKAPAALPDFLLSPNAVFNDAGAQWRYGRPPDYSKTRKVWEEGRKMNHEAGSLPQLVENLVKNWEVEASFKPRLSDWRTIDQDKYTFAMSGGPPQSADHMLTVGTYNAIIAPNEYYDPTNSDFASSHKTFKRMMPTFAWEVMEVYSGPPKVVFRWRHWGEMKNDYVGFNNKGQKVTAKAHGGPIEIFGTTVAVIDDRFRVLSLDTYMDSLDMFRQIAPHGLVNTEPIDRKAGLSDVSNPTAPDHDGVKIAEEHGGESSDHGQEPSQNADAKHISNATGEAADAHALGQGACPVVGIVNSGAVAPHPIPSQSQNGGSMADAAPSPAEPAQSEVSAAPHNASEQAETAHEQSAAKQNHPPSSVLEPPSDANAGPPDGGALTSRPQVPSDPAATPTVYSSPVTGDLSSIIDAANDESHVDESTATGTHDAVDAHLEQPTEVVHPHPHDAQAAVQPAPGEAVVVPADAAETRRTKEEMSAVRPEDSALVMNRE